ncbi:MAG: hypothetical protein M1838_000312 [Thelocarpon superellum]|nr:MAG: hypothetical protein M1838_000312 [Thelocarpon superellum]
MTTGRNGEYAVHEMTCRRTQPDPPNITFTTVHVAAPPLGPMIEGAYVDRRNKVLVYGFRSKEFIMWNDSDQQEIMAVDCGGAHRNWSFVPNTDDAKDGGSFAWMQASRLRFTSRPHSHRILHAGSHGREIKTVAVSKGRLSGECSTIFATGAEDTTIRISSVTREDSRERGGEFKTMAVLRKHTAGVQHVQWTEDDGYLFSGGGIDEVYAWRIRRISGFGIGVVCEAALPVEPDLPGLRVMTFDLRTLHRGESDEMGGFLLAVVYGDSAIRVSQPSPFIFRPS